MKSRNRTGVVADSDIVIKRLCSLYVHRIAVFTRLEETVAGTKTITVADVIDSNSVRAGGGFSIPRNIIPL